MGKEDKDVRVDEAQTSPWADDGVDVDAERLRSWYESVMGEAPTHEETIGLLGGISKGKDQDGNEKAAWISWRCSAAQGMTG